MLKPFSYGIGGWLGDGKQYTSWISIRDAVGAFIHAADHDACSGAYNGTVPQPISNYEWCKSLGEVLHKPVLTHAPKWALRGALGELADDIFLASTRAVPDRLLASGYLSKIPISARPLPGWSNKRVPKLNRPLLVV